ncbi:TPA: hypothetical protein DDZ86_04005 [Candidatus Dependentiae bacterium]|nr:MAG: hypothetical protein UW09_C0003G0152 [candidate division TM6 bacterium GW2011_GWF2_43_87]HBL98779.1 hypothetical protein [Candidatus Dependentiae bacterium]
MKKVMGLGLYPGVMKKLVLLSTVLLGLVPWQCVADETDNLARALKSVAEKVTEQDVANEFFRVIGHLGGVKSEDSIKRAKELIALGAEVNPPAGFMTPLAISLDGMNIEASKLLIEENANVNAKTNANGKPVIGWARKPEAFKLLVEHGAYLFEKMPHNQGTAWDRAVGKGVYMSSYMKPLDFFKLFFPLKNTATYQAFLDSVLAGFGDAMTSAVNSVALALKDEQKLLNMGVALTSQEKKDLLSLVQKFIKFFCIDPKNPDLTLKTSLFFTQNEIDLCDKLFVSEPGLLQKHIAQSKIWLKFAISPNSKPVFDKRTAYDLNPIAKHPVTLYVTSGNMLLQKVDVVVDAANAGIAHWGGGVTGSLHDAFLKYLEITGLDGWDWWLSWAKQRFIDKGLKQEDFLISRDFVGTIGALKVGEAWLNGPEALVVTYQDTPGHKLFKDVKGVGPLMRIIHTLAPSNAKVKDVNDPLWQQLYNCIFNSLKEADRGGLHRIAIPLIGSGVFGCLSEVVIHAEVRAATDYLIQTPASQIQEIHLTSFLGSQEQSYQDLIKAMDELIKEKGWVIKKSAEEPASNWG